LYLNAGGLLLCKTGGLVDVKIDRLSREDGLLLVPQLSTVDVLLTACQDKPMLLLRQYCYAHIRPITQTEFAVHSKVTKNGEKKLFARW